MSLLFACPAAVRQGLALKKALHMCGCMDHAGACTAYARSVYPLGRSAPHRTLPDFAAGPERRLTVFELPLDC